MSNTEDRQEQGPTDELNLVGYAMTVWRRRWQIAWLWVTARDEMVLVHDPKAGKLVKVLPYPLGVTVVEHTPHAEARGEIDPPRCRIDLEIQDVHQAGILAGIGGRQHLSATSHTIVTAGNQEQHERRAGEPGGWRSETPADLSSDARRRQSARAS